MRIITLGTSGATPAKGRGMPSVAVIREGDVYLFDCGEGTQMKMMQYGVNFSRTKAIFLSHVHGDHIIGIAGLLRTLAVNSRKDPLLIFVPAGFEKNVATLITFDRALMRYEIRVIGVKKAGVIFEGKGFKISAFAVNHSIPTLGYVFKEDDRRNFLVEKSKALGIKDKMFGELQRKGYITVKGKRISLGSVTTEKAGKKFVYATDTRPTASTIKAAAKADVLVHEATFTENEKELAIERKHSTAKEAATIAKKAKVHMLVLTHISARHRTTAALLKEAKAVFENTVVAKDGYAIEI